MTTGYDAQRSFWVRADNKISPQRMQKPGFDFVWMMKFDNAPRQLNNLTAPALLDFYIGYRGFRTLAFFGGSSDRVFGVDSDLARPEWEFKGTPAGGGAGTYACPGGMTAAVTRPTSRDYPMAALGRGMGRGTPAKSAVSEPNAGAVTIRPVSPTARPVVPAKPVPAGANPFAARIQWVMALTGDGKLHSFYVSNGEEPNPAIAFLPPNANAMGLVVYDNVAYATTANGCGGVADGVWALNMETKKVSQWKAPKPVAGNAGAATRPDGTVFVAAGNQIFALKAETLQQAAQSPARGAAFTSSPVVLEFKGKDLLAVSSADGRVQIFDSANLAAGSLAQSEAYSPADYAVGALASWLDDEGTRWVLAPAGGAVSAWKVVDKGGKPALEAGWKSQAMVSPLTPIVVNGVVFALSSGEFRTNDARMTAEQRAQKSSKAVLYALDGTTGKEFWNSGGKLTSFVHSGGLSAGGTRVYVSTQDGTQYAFGYPIETLGN